MRLLTTALIVTLLFCVGCAGSGADSPAVPQPDAQPGTTTERNDQANQAGRFVNWGVYHLEIARDGSYAKVIPDRYANAAWGYHLNAVKLLEVAPCANCLTTGNVHLLPNGDVSVDISITHPWPAFPVANLYCTGFDVRGIIMFPASQYWPDDELRVQAGLEPWESGWKRRWSSHDKGDAELMNPDGWTSIWAPDCRYYRGDFRLEEGLPIFDYYPGKFASGENLGTFNAFKRFHTNENRHMFEVGKSDTRTYIIRPPADGPIKASYAIYAHWAPPHTMPITDPAADFPPEANSPMPYEFWIEQTALIDPDAPDEENGLHIHWHIKTWDIDYTLWLGSEVDLLYCCAPGGGLRPHPDGNPDVYRFTDFCVVGYKRLDNEVPGTLPGAWPYIFRVEIFDPDNPQDSLPLGTDFYITKIEIDEVDGEW